MNVLIFSELSDSSTGNVVDWLSEFGHTVFRINEEDTIENIGLRLDNQNVNICLEVAGKIINLKEIDSVWYRRGHLTINSKINFPKDIDMDIQKVVLYNLFDEELTTIKEFIEHYLSNNKPHLGNNFKRNSNKLITLQKAKEVGLKIPTSEVNSEKTPLINFFKKHNKDCISKGVQDILTFAVNNKGYHYTTSKIEQEDLEEMNDSFFPSLLQKNIKKKYELRIFYLNKRFFAMAIFSQNDEQTSVDFRNYNYDKPNRNVPFILPDLIKEKLELFMQSMNLDTGSIDMIVNTENEYIFLEVNPSGQFGMTSIPCGYHLDYEIAKEITRN